MNVESLCKRPVVHIPSDASVQDAAALMCQEHVGALAVVTRSDPPQVVGILTDRDLALEVVGRRQPAFELTAGDIAKGPAVTVPVGASVHEAVAAMQAHGVRRLLIVDAGGDVVGVVSSDDLLAALALDLAALASALHEGIERESSARGVAGVRGRQRLVHGGFGMAASQ